MPRAVEEFFIEAQADDDYAVKNLQLVYSVNGGAEKTVSLFDGSRVTNEVTAGHTFYMEELGVKAGDSVSYYAQGHRQRRGRRARSSRPATSIFLRIRPFDKNFKPATSMSGGGGGGGGGGGQEVGALSQQQRQIIAGTFNIQRDRKKLAADEVPREHGGADAGAEQAARPGRTAWSSA